VVPNYAADERSIALVNIPKDNEVYYLFDGTALVY
jgi:hypothetical protein